MQRGASQAQLRRAYLRQLVTAHPDKGGQPERFQQLQAAFAVLSDPAERRIYDEKLERVHGGSNGSSAATASADSSCSCSRGGGVTAVVHGQTQGGGQQPPGPDEQPAGACPAARSGSALEEASADIRALQQAAGASSGSSCSSGGPAASGRLAEAYLRRAGLRREAGQLHHALFDAEEALRLQPDLEKAAELVAALQAALQLPQAAAAQGEEDQHHPGEDQLDDEPL